MFQRRIVLSKLADTARHASGLAPEAEFRQGLDLLIAGFTAPLPAD